MMAKYFAKMYEYGFDWIVEHFFYPILEYGKIDRDWDLS